MEKELEKLLKELEAENSKAMRDSAKGIREEAYSITDFCNGKSTAFEFVITRLNKILNKRT